MKKLLLLALSMVLLRMPGTAAPCMTATLATYLTMPPAGCTLGNLQISGFSYSAKASGGTPTITPEEITVAVVLAPAGTFGFQVTAPWGVHIDQSQTSDIGYHVLAPSASVRVAQVQLDGLDFEAGVFAAVTVDATIATSATTHDLQTFLKCAATCKSQTSATLDFLPAAPLLVINDRVKLQTKGGSATALGFTNWLVACLPCT